MEPRAQDVLRCWAEVDLAALERNVKAIRVGLPAHVRYISVVKADAYGHGMPEVAGRLIDSGVQHFAVANVAEAAALRGAGWEGPVLVLGPTIPGEEPMLCAFDLAATISGVEDVSRIGRAGSADGRPVPVHMKIDTGMGRAGVWHEDAPKLYRQVLGNPNLHLEGVFTHFASADDDMEFTAGQRRRFLDALGRCGALERPGLMIHADNSAGLETMPCDGPFNAVRVGLLQYGVSPMPDPALARFKADPVLSLHARVGTVKRLARGTDIGYGRTHTLAKDSTVALLCAGYADGVQRAASNRAQVLLHGRRCPVLGRISMDQTVVDVSELAGVACGDEAVLIGRQGGQEITANEASHWAGTIPWETLCAITKRVPRIYLQS